MLSSTLHWVLNSSTPGVTPSRQLSAISIEIIKPFQSTGKLSLKIFGNNLRNIKTKPRGQHQFFYKNQKSLIFSIFFSNKSYFFCVILNSMIEMLSFEVLHVEIAQKLKNLEISLIFSNFLIDFEFSPIFLVIFEKNF